MSTAAIPPALQQKLLAGPAAPPPPGLTSYFGGPNPFVAAAIANFVIAHTIITTCVTLRLYMQHFVSSGLVTEDFLILAAAVIQVGLDATGLLCVEKGLRKHMWNMTLGNFVDLMKIVYAYGIIYSVCTCLIKVAILLQLVRVFATQRMNRVTWFACWSAIIVIILFTIVNAFLLIFQCSPIEGAWNVFKANRCLSLKNIYESSGIFNIVSDFAILIIPIPLILKLNMRLRRRLAMAAVFATGALACVASILRYYYILRIYDTMDVPYYLGPMGLVSTIEQSIGIFIFCVPKLHQFFHYVKSAIQRSMSAASLMGSDTSVEQQVEKATPNKAVREPYSMPSLASFEEREASSRMASTASHVDRMPSINSV